jgi:SAM-dependent methyltransferase
MVNPSGLKKLIPRPVKSVLRSVLDRIPLSVEHRPLRPKFQGEEHRYEYQKNYVDFNIGQGERVLDIGSGGDPFPYATHLVDRHLEPTVHRHGPIINNSTPLVAADVHHLPFQDKYFDFVYCAHILEHVDDPVKACREIMRVGKRGYIETPMMGEDMLFAWAEGRHKWHVVSCANTLCFFEYSPRQLKGIGSSAWEEVIMGHRYHPLQKAYFDNRDIFDVMFPWEDNFRVFVFYLDGRIENSDC